MSRGEFADLMGRANRHPPKSLDLSRDPGARDDQSTGIQMFENYDPSSPSLGAVNELTEQILEVLYTVRNNLFHGGKQADDANDREVIERALPLLAIIVGSFLRNVDVVNAQRLREERRH